MKKRVKHKLKRVAGFPTVVAIYGRKKTDNVNPNLTTKSMAKQRKRTFGIFKKSEERDSEY